MVGGMGCSAGLKRQDVYGPRGRATFLLRSVRHPYWDETGLKAEFCWRIVITLNGQYEKFPAPVYQGIPAALSRR